MGEFLQRDSNDPHYVPDSKGASGDTGKYLQAVALAQTSGRSVEECLAFLGVSKPEGVASALSSASQSVPPLPKELENKTILLPIEESLVTDEEAKELAPVKPVKEVPADGFVVTEVIDPEQATPAELDQAFPEEDENDWSGKIREGSKVKVVYSNPSSKIKWQGKVGKCIRVIGNEKAKVYEVEFKGQKIAKVRLNKKTGKLERGYMNKRLVTTFDQEDIELA